MLRTIVMRAWFLFVALCLVLAGPARRPTPSHGDPTEARLDITKSRVEVAPRREGESRDPRHQRALALGLPAVPFTIVSPPRFAVVLETDAPAHTVVPVVFARSSRGPPVGSLS
jgi:hypothetical protein